MPITLNQRYTCARATGAEANLAESKPRLALACGGAFNMLYCDGRVEAVGYDVDPAVHMRAGDRR